MLYKLIAAAYLLYAIVYSSSFIFHEISEKKYLSAVGTTILIILSAFILIILF